MTNYAHIMYLHGISIGLNLTGFLSLSFVSGSAILISLTTSPFLQQNSHIRLESN
jgi:hypothetical protein